MLLFKLIIVILLLFVIASLFTALYQLNQDRGEGSSKVVKALTVRIGLSIFLFVLLMVGQYFGLIVPHGVYG
ncbi:MAG: twin transmembrane helix small protein [Thiothrix sp.]|nr:twin transmembrane helix small protein [Thiothrix sp.]HPQ94638.1 twin transmembrane helix small protein [Thiolinea sp.]